MCLLIYLRDISDIKIYIYITGYILWSISDQSCWECTNQKDGPPRNIECVVFETEIIDVPKETKHSIVYTI